MGTGQIGDENGAVVHVRHAFDDGTYHHVGQLTMTDVANADDFTLQKIQRRHESFRTPEYFEHLRALNAL